MQATQTTADLLNDLLRGELAAMENYDQVLNSVPEGPVWEELLRIHSEHADAVSRLRQDVLHFGGRPARNSTDRDDFARMGEGAGAKPTLQTLKECEKQGVSSYRHALVQELLPPECQLLISTSLLPQTEEHVQRLNYLIHAS
jgi:bacterioferritin (cytochrome b1)